MSSLKYFYFINIFPDTAGNGRNIEILTSKLTQYNNVIIIINKISQIKNEIGEKQVHMDTQRSYCRHETGLSLHSPSVFGTLANPSQINDEYEKNISMMLKIYIDTTLISYGGHYKGQ